MRPKAELGDYKGLEVGRAEIDVPEEAIGEELERLRVAFGSLSPVDRPAAEGDAVVIDFEGMIDGEPFEGSSSKDFTIELGGEGLLPEFDAALTGAATGDERDRGGHLPRGPSARGARRQDRELRGDGQGGAREEPPRARRRLRLRGLGVRHARRAPREHSLAARGGPRPARRGGLPRGGRRRGRREREARDPARAGARTRPRDVGADRASARRPAASTRRPTPRCRARIATT